MSEKELTGRIILKNDTSTNWNKATNFVPKKGELIFYTDLNKIKIGNGVSTVTNLPFIEFAFTPDFDIGLADLILAKRSGGDYVGFQYYNIRSSLQTYFNDLYAFNTIVVVSESNSPNEVFGYMSEGKCVLYVDTVNFVTLLTKGFSYDDEDLWIIFEGRYISQEDLTEKIMVVKGSLYSDEWTITSKDCTISAGDVLYDPSETYASGTVGKAIQEKASIIDFETIVGTIWIGTEAPYTQEIVVNGLEDNDKPIVGPKLTSDYDAELDEYSKIFKIVASNNLLTLYAITPTEQEITIQLRCFR